MERIAIIDHETHRLYVEDIDDFVLEHDYGGDEQKFIENTYDITNYSWDYIVETIYFPEPSVPPLDEPVVIKFEELYENT